MSASHFLGVCLLRLLVAEVTPFFAGARFIRLRGRTPGAKRLCIILLPASAMRRLVAFFMLCPDMTSSAMRTLVFNLRTDCLVRDLVGFGHRRTRAVHQPPDARNTRCNSSSEQSGPALSKMECHGHLAVLEWHEPSSVVSYIDLYRLELGVQQRHVVNVNEPIIYRGTVTSANRKGP